MAKASAAAKSGRPRAPKNRSKEPVTTVLSRCRRCGSTEREPYHGTREVKVAGVDPHSGKPYTHVVWRRTRCKHCGQMRMDRSLEQR